MVPAGHWVRRHAAWLGLASAVSLSGWLWPQSLNGLELLFLQASQELRGPRAVPSGVTIVAIDDFSLQQAQNSDLSNDVQLKTLGSWPWPRAVYADLVQHLLRCGASAVAIDLLFDTPSSHGAADDNKLLASLQRQRSRLILGAQILESRGSLAGLSLSQPLQKLQQAAGPGGLGLLNGHPDPDGTLRAWPSLFAKDMRQAGLPQAPPSLAVAALAAAGHQKAARHQPPPGWTPLLDPYGPARTIPTIPIWQLLTPASAAELCRSGIFRQQVVLIGPTAAVFQDLHHTALAGQEGLPGVEIHATEVANRLEGRPLLFLPQSALWSAVLGATCLGLGLASRRWDRPLSRLTWLGAIGLGWILLGAALAAQLAIGLRLFSLAAVSLLTGVVSSGEATVRLQWQRRRLRQSLERYLSPAVAAQIADRSTADDELLGGQQAEVVVLLTDLRGFTRYTHQMSRRGQAVEVVDRLNAYFTELVSAIHAHGGTVDKFIGDSCLAVFGAPLHRGNGQEANAALDAAEEIQQRLQTLNTHWSRQGIEPWQQVIAISFGSVISGNIGSPSRMDYTVIGDAVNSASRLEAIAKANGYPLVITEAVAQLLDGSRPLRDLGLQELRGQEPLRVFAVESVHDDSSTQEKPLEDS